MRRTPFETDERHVAAWKAITGQRLDCYFLPWLTTKWAEWRTITGHPAHLPASVAQVDGFNHWLFSQIPGQPPDPGHVAPV